MNFSFHHSIKRKCFPNILIFFFKFSNVCVFFGKISREMFKIPFKCRTFECCFHNRKDWSYVTSVDCKYVIKP